MALLPFVFTHVPVPVPVPVSVSVALLLSIALIALISMGNKYIFQIMVDKGSSFTSGWGHSDTFVT